MHFKLRPLLYFLDMLLDIARKKFLANFTSLLRPQGPRVQGTQGVSMAVRETNNFEVLVKEQTSDLQGCRGCQTIGHGAPREPYF